VVSVLPGMAARMLAGWWRSAWNSHMRRHREFTAGNGGNPEHAIGVTISNQKRTTVEFHGDA
jgi:hypothetical protein